MWGFEKPPGKASDIMAGLGRRIGERAPGEGECPSLPKASAVWSRGFLGGGEEPAPEGRKRFGNYRPWGRRTATQAHRRTNGQAGARLGVAASWARSRARSPRRAWAWRCGCRWSRRPRCHRSVTEASPTSLLWRRVAVSDAVAALAWTIPRSVFEFILCFCVFVFWRSTITTRDRHSPRLMPPDSSRPARAGLLASPPRIAGTGVAALGPRKEISVSGRDAVLPL